MGTRSRPKRPRGKKGSPGIWQQSGRRFWYCWVGGRRINLGLDRIHAEAEFHRLKLAESTAAPTTATVTLLELCDRLLTWTRDRRRPRTYDWYRERLRTILRHLDPAMPAASIRPHHIDDWLISRPDWSASFKFGLTRAIQRVYSHAAKQGVLQVNPLLALEKTAPKPRRLIVTAKHIDGILSAANPRIRDLIEFCLETGCRAEEVVRIQSRHYDAVHRLIVFPPEERKRGDKLTKPRIIYLTPRANEIASRLAAEHPTGPMFRNTRGKPYWKNSLHLQFRRWRTLGLIPPGVCMTQLRHYYVTEARKRLSASDVAALVGHADSRMVERVYSHLEERTEHMRELARKAIGSD